MIRLFRALIPISLLLLLFVDLVLVALSYLGGFFVAGYASSGIDFESFLFYESGGVNTALAVLALFAGFYFQDFYDRGPGPTRTVLFQQVCFAVGAGFLVQALLSVVEPDLVLPRRMMTIGSVFAGATVFLWHIFFQNIQANIADKKRMIFLGASAAVFELADHLKAHPELGLAPLGYLDHSPAPDATATIPWLGPPDHYARVIDSAEPAWIVIGQPDDLQPWWVDDFLELRFGGVQVERVDTLFEESFGRISLTQIRPAGLDEWRRLEPGIGDRLQTLAAGVLFLVLLPLLLLIALLVKLTSAGPVLIHQEVAGLYGKPFWISRFRCTVDAQGGQRTTALGSLLRRTHLERLPYLFGVVQGYMALAGPSPHRVDYSQRLAELIPVYTLRQLGKPGLVSWAGLRSEAPCDAIRELEYDLYQVKSSNQNRLISFDLLVFMRALKEIWR